MADVIPFRKLRLNERHKGNTLCRHGHHKWEPVKQNPFAVKQGKLITADHCSRCGTTRNRAS